jgi:transposase-like protein
MSNNLKIEMKAQVVGMLCEGVSIRSIERLTGIHRDTVMRLGVRMGEASEKVMDAKMKNLNGTRWEVDEIWGFIGKKQRHVSATERGYGDVWTFIALDADTKLIPCFVVGKRDMYHARAFMDDLASRLKNRVQLSSDHATAAFGSGTMFVVA